MRHLTTSLIGLLLLLTSVALAQAQTRAITSDGCEVILYPNGTWAYIQGQPAPYPQPSIGADEPVTIERGASGRRVGILIHRQLLFVLNDGQLEDLYIYDTRGRLAYSYREGVYQLPYGWRVQYELGSERVRQVGPHAFKYHWSSGQLEQVGMYELEYDLLSNRVTEIGDYDVEYDFFTNRISEVGDIKIEYDHFTKGIKEIRGKERNVEVYFLRDDRSRPQPFL